QPAAIQAEQARLPWTGIHSDGLGRLDVGVSGALPNDMRNTFYGLSNGIVARNTARLHSANSVFYFMQPNGYGYAELSPPVTIQSILQANPLTGNGIIAYRSGTGLCQTEVEGLGKDSTDLTFLDCVRGVV